ncbi:hypothetical protein [Nocardioides sp. LHD-245]|uniref:hypothetical protein n=1 Tax=Nocardioides sp. LHD-245 TaxID=3051387 RepID=UPI00370961C3
MVIGNAATVVMLVPEMAADAAHVAMLQRAPTYVMPIPRVDELANNLCRWFGVWRVLAVASSPPGPCNERGP